MQKLKVQSLQKVLITFHYITYLFSIFTTIGVRAVRVIISRTMALGYLDASYESYKAPFLGPNGAIPLRIIV